MPLVGTFPEHLEHAGLQPQRKITVDTDVAGDAIGEHKTDALHFPRQKVGIFLDAGDGVGAQDAKDPERQRRADTVALKKDHDVLHAALLLPCLHDAPGAHLTDTVDF